MLYDLGILQFIAPPLTRHRGAMLKDVVITETDTAIEIPGRKRNLNMNINAQQVILNAYISNNSSLY